MARALPSSGHHTSELRFWACFAVVLALLSQMLFPPQVMAAATAHGTAFVLCTAGVDAAPIADPATVKAFKASHTKSGLQGLKCADCVIHSITAIATPEATFMAAVYATVHADLQPLRVTAPVKARAPPRPHSCGPPSIRS